MKLINSLTLITIATINFNPNALAMQEPSAPSMNEMQEGPSALHMDMREPRRPEVLPHSSNICARCFYGILDRLNEAGCCSRDAKECFCHSLKLLAGCGCCAVSLVGMFDAMIGCAAPREYMSDWGRIFCDGTGGAVCTICAASSGVYMVYQYCQLCCLTRWRQSVEEERKILQLATQVETIIQENARREPGELREHKE